MNKRKILFIGGSLNQTTMMHEISKHLGNYDCWFSPYYDDGFVGYLAAKGLLNFTILGGTFKKQTEEYIIDNKLQIDYKGIKNDYDLVYTSADLLIPKNIKKKKIILVQEGMTDPEKLPFYLVKYFNFPRWAASTSAMGMSNLYDVFCVASEGYKELFIKKGAKKEKIVVTGIPNFDNAKKYLNNNFPYKNYVLVATSDMRETFKYENRKKFIKECVKIANGKQLIFKLHPNENFERAIKEINEYAPGALVFHNGNTNHMIANCDVLITKYSSVVYIGLALGKKVYSSFNIDELKRLMPLQNNGTSAERIARIGRRLLDSPETTVEEIREEIENLDQVGLNAQQT
ncbi:hypothetical protein ABRY23_13490 [Melioribacteraceae bacterium 4301-Me]|uniref:hypothetical protein n=1 Tax=Pyranulibacter aquaticus TaxID=3163344 RepID=UPI00359BF61B